MSSITTAVHPDKDSVYFQGSLTQMQSKQYANINRDNVTFLEIIKQEPRKQSYTDTTEFDSLISRFPFLSNKFIYKKVIDDARVIPDDIVMKNRMDEYFSPRFYKNILRIYQNSPLYFDYLFSREGIGEQRHKQYSVYIYTLCLIEYIMKHYDSNDFKLIHGCQMYYNWALPKYSEQVSYIIKGPLSKSSSIKIDFKKHYATIMNPSNVEGDMTQFLQLASLQNVDTKLTQFISLISKMNNAYDKLKDEARTYNLIIRSRNVKCYNDSTLNNTFVIDLRGCDFGETTEAHRRTATMNTIISTSIDISSRLSIHKLQELFAGYSRFRIVSCFVNRELYSTALDALSDIDITFHGIEVASRSVMAIGNKQYNSSTDSPSSLSVPGRFTRDTIRRSYSFEPSIDTITYASEKVRVTDARIYLSSNGKPLSALLTGTELNIPNVYNIEITNSKNPNSIHSKNAGFIKTYYYTLSDQIVTNNDSGILKVDNTLAYIETGSAANISAFKHGSSLLFESSPYSYYKELGGNNLIPLSDWDGTSEVLKKIVDPVSEELNESIIIPCTANAVYGYNKDHGIWNERDFAWSIFAIDTSTFSSIFGNVVSGISSSATYNFSFIVNVDGEIRHAVINQSSLPDTLSNGNFILTATISSFGSNMIDVSASFKNSEEIVIHTIPLFEGLPITARIKILYLISSTDIRYTEAVFTDNEENGIACTFYHGLCFLPPSSMLFTLFNDPVTFTNLELTPCIESIHTLYTVTRILPSLIMNEAYGNIPAFYTNYLLTGNGTNNIMLIDDNEHIAGTMIVDRWRNLALFTSTNVKEIDYANHYNLVLEMSDLFNIQLEFS